MMTRLPGRTRRRADRGAAVIQHVLEKRVADERRASMRFGDLSRKPNILIIITDQEREVMHWPEGGADANLPARCRLIANGLHFTRARATPLHVRRAGQPV
jgi:hypothetical protein